MSLSVPPKWPDLLPRTRPITVNVSPRNPNSAQTTPTPDLPHALPTQRDALDQYTVQSGDTLGNIAQKYGITLEALMQANGLNELSILIVGMVLDIPPVEADPNQGSSFKMIPDSELVYGPASAQFDVDLFVHEHNGYLANYTQDVNGETLSGYTNYYADCAKLFGQPAFIACAS